MVKLVRYMHTYVYVKCYLNIEKSFYLKTLLSYLKEYDVIFDLYGQTETSTLKQVCIISVSSCSVTHLIPCCNFLPDTKVQF